MAQPITKLEQPITTMHDVHATVAAGGQIAAMRRTIEERMMAADMATALALDVPSEDRLVRLFSRAAGPALLIVAYAAVASWWW